MRTTRELHYEVLERSRRLLATAEEIYYHDFGCAINAINRAYSYLVCFGGRMAWFCDKQIESPLKRAVNAEQYYNEVKHLYDETLRLVEGSIS